MKSASISSHSLTTTINQRLNYWHRIISLTSQMRIYPCLPQGIRSGLADKLHFSGHNTFWHCSSTFKLNKHAKCLSLGINSWSMKMELNLSLPTSTKAGLLLQHHCLHFKQSHLFVSFWNVIPIIIVVSYCIVATLLATLLCLASYEQCSTGPMASIVFLYKVYFHPHESFFFCAIYFHLL